MAGDWSTRSGKNLFVNALCEDDRPVVLVVEDDPQVRRILLRLLQRTFRVLEATSAEEAMPIVEKEDVAVAISDYILPEEDGLSFLTRLCTVAPKVQRILLTGHASEEVMMRGINEARLFRFFQKPFDLEPLVQAVDLACVEHDILKTMDVVAAEHEQLKAEVGRWDDRSKRMGSATAHMLGHASRLLSGLVVMVTATVGICVLIALVGLVVVYVSKMMLGIDLFKNMHLEDFLSRMAPGKG